MPSVKDIPQITAALFSAYASSAAFLVLIRSMINDLLPDELRSYIYTFLGRFFTPTPKDFTLIVDELSGYSNNQVYEAAEIYLRTKPTSPSTRHLRVSKTARQKRMVISIENGEEIDDLFDEMKLKWTYVCNQPENQREKRYFQLTFDRKLKEKVIESYLPYVMERANAIKQEQRVLKLYNRECPYDEEDGSGGGTWGSIVLEHPATFEKLAMDPTLKDMIIDDLNRFLRRKEFYKKVGKAWKRGYLLYGPPGTGKSSLVAAIANHLKFNIYDLDLANVSSNSELRSILLSTTNRSILLIEDIDCSKEVQDRESSTRDEFSVSKFTLSGFLNFIDGLWSSCGEERIIIFTTNRKDKLDPALLRPGRMDVHIHMSHCTSHGFRILASNYLGISDHSLFTEIEGLIDNTEVTPAEIAEELMKSEHVDVALKGLIEFLKHKKIEVGEIKGEGSETAEHQEADGLVDETNQLTD